MDTGVVVALLGLIGVIVSAVIGAYVATNTNKVEKKKVADETVEAVLRERMAFKDERIEWLEEALAARDLVIRELREQLDPKDEQ